MGSAGLTGHQGVATSAASGGASTIGGGVGAIAGLAQMLFGRNTRPMTRNPVANLIAETTLGFASFGIAPLIRSLQKPKKVYDPLRDIKRMQRLIEQDRVGHWKFREAEANFARKRQGRLTDETIAAGRYSEKVARESVRISQHHDIFGQATARDVLKIAAPRTLEVSRVGKPRFGFVPAGTRSRKLTLETKLARLDAHPPRMVERSGAPISFSEEQIAQGFALSRERLAGLPIHVAMRGPRDLAERFWRQNNPADLLELENVRSDIAAKSWAVSPPDPLVTETDTTTEEPVSITGTPTGIFNQATGAIGEALNTFGTPGVQGGLNAIANIIAATRRPQQPLAGSPMSGQPLALPGAVMPGGAPSNGATPVGLESMLDLPFVDIMAQGTASNMRSLTRPFHETAAGNQVAQPFVSVKANGKTEWFIPAGQPKTWTKASRKRSHRHAHHHPR